MAETAVQIERPQHGDDTHVLFGLIAVSRSTRSEYRFVVHRAHNPYETGAGRLVDPADAHQNRCGAGGRKRREGTGVSSWHPARDPLTTSVWAARAGR